MIESDDSEYDFQIRPAPLRTLLSFKLAVNFSKCLPNFAGVSWHKTQTPVYYTSSFQGRFQSKQVVRKLFFFLQQVIKEDLYQHSICHKGLSEVESSLRQLFYKYNIP